ARIGWSRGRPLNWSAANATGAGNECGKHAERCTPDALDSTAGPHCPDSTRGSKTSRTFHARARLAPRRILLYHKRMSASNAPVDALPRRLGLWSAVTIVVG